MDKLKMHTPNRADENFKKLAALFPNAVTETINENGEVVRAIDKDVLMQEISCTVVDGNEERYQFTWPDKKKSVLLANAPISKTLRPYREESVGKDGTPGGFDSENLYIEGDNLEVLKLLQETYLGKIKMIYIDPPYNTGNDFVYEDDFAQSTEEYLANSGQFDDGGNRLVANTENNGRFHTDWLNMIYPRLRIAKDLLTPDGVIFISIDDNELENLKKICDEIFGASNFVNIISLKTKDSSGASGGGEDRRLKKNIEFVLCYAKGDFTGFKELYRPVEIGQFLSEMEASNRSFKYTTVFTNLGKKEYVKTIKDGSGQDMIIYKHTGYETKSLKKISQEENCSIIDVFYRYLDRICTTENAQTSIRTRIKKATMGDDGLFSVEYMPISGRNKNKLTTIYFVGEQKRLVSWFDVLCIKENGIIYKKEKVGTFWSGFNWNNVAREGGVPYPNGKKAVAFVEQLCKVGTTVDEDDIVLDFFSGSATTAHAVMNCNNRDGGNRKFIMVQLPEIPELSSVEYDFDAQTICEIGKERIRRAGAKIKEEDPLGTQQLDVGFRVLKCDSSNMKDVYYSPADYEADLFDFMTDNIKEDRTPEDLLFQVMLDLGIELSSKIEEKEIAGKKVFDVADGFLIACFDADVNDETIKAIAQKQPYYFVMRDSSLANDSVAANFEQIFAAYSPDTVRKVL
ncbi:site-specific DNA-methyltransferase [Blautia sp. An46]|uniref:site-specific DNA-methyltransferase n=1 Tax=Blautia sp. An46 TaxID=1965636 RepID=UPI000B398AF5|nr:site-specific DNA-methyltransferase [Blautia sp. An46]OUN93201.1 site-specific DNA-methyltransferase [Blautia sp. An46]